MQRKKGVLLLSILMVFVLASCSQVEQPTPSVSPSEEVKPTIYESMEPSPVVSPSTEPTPSAVVTPSVEPSPIPSLSPSATPTQEQKPNSNSVTTSSGGTTTEKLPSPPPAPAPELPASSGETGPGMDFGDALDKWSEQQKEGKTQEQIDEFNKNQQQGCESMGGYSSDGLTSSDEDASFVTSGADIIKGMQEQGGPGAPGGGNMENGFDPLE